MDSRSALRELAEVTESQWGMVTSAQATARGVSHLNLSRLAESEDLVRLAHGVYRVAGAPSDEHEALRAAWLSVEPGRFAWERVRDRPGFATVSGESAARLHGIGNFRAMRSEFTTPVRKQTQRRDVRYRTRTLTEDEVTICEGLPVTTPERTIADLVEDRVQFDHVADALRDAAGKSRIDTGRLTKFLAPLAERNGQRRGDGEALLQQLREAAGIDGASLSKQIARIPDLGARVTRDYLASIDLSPLFHTPALRSLASGQREQLAALSRAISTLVVPNAPSLGSIAQPRGSVDAAAATMQSEAALRSIRQVLNAVDWASLAQTIERQSPAGEDEP